MTGRRLLIVGVMGSGVDSCADRTAPLGRWLAGQDVHLLTGGGGGVMAAVTRAFVEVTDRRGLAFGILPASSESGGVPLGYPNAWVDVPIVTHLPGTGDLGVDRSSRNHINVLSSTVVVALPGGAGTASEVRLAVHYGRPVVGFLRSRDEIPGLPSDVPIRADLAGVQAFVTDALRKE